VGEKLPARLASDYLSFVFLPHLSATAFYPY